MTKYHYNYVIIGAMLSQITSLKIVYSTVYSGADQRKHQSSASLTFVRGIHRGPVNSPHKWPVTRRVSPPDDVIMISMHISFKRTTANCNSPKRNTAKLTNAFDRLKRTFHQSQYLMPPLINVWHSSGKESTHLYTWTTFQWRSFRCVQGWFVWFCQTYLCGGWPGAPLTKID